MKLVLANNQSARFVDFYGELRTASNGAFDYAGYRSLVTRLDNNSQTPISVYSTQTNKYLTDYDGVYINGYLNTLELATNVALSCEFLGIAFMNRELGQAPSLSKLTCYTKLVAAGLPIPVTLAGAKAALLALPQDYYDGMFPAVLKRADADRGIDNFKVRTVDEVVAILTASDNINSPWILQQYVKNDGYYVINFYDSQPEFAIFRSLQARPDGNVQKAHMYKPKGGANARLVDIADMPPTLIAVAERSMQAMNRQIGSVDCLYDGQTDTVHILEVNFNPQLVTVEVFSEVRRQAFVKHMGRKW